MSKKIVITILFCCLVIVSLLFVDFHAAPDPKFRKAPDLLKATYELEYLISSSNIALIGKVVENVDAGEPLYKGKFDPRDSREYKKFKARILVLMKIKGEIDEDSVTFDYYEPKYQFGFSSLSVGDTILLAPETNYSFGLENHIVLSSNGKLFDNLWYKNIDFKKGAEILKFLGYRVYDKQAALNIFEKFYGRKIPNEFETTFTDQYGWRILGKCNRPLGWGCAQKDFCYTISSFSGSLMKCNDYTRPTFPFPDR